MLTKIYTHHIFGEIVITKKNSNKNIRLTVSPSKGIRVSIPFFIRFSRAEAFINERENWIKETIEKQKDKTHSREIPLGEGHEINLINCTVIFHKGPVASSLNNKVIIRSVPGCTNIYYPEGIPRSVLADAVLKVIKKRAAEYLPIRAAELAGRYGFKFNKIFLKNNKTNWGSCSNKNNINLNIHLMRLDKSLADYVIMHELCHLKQHNHGPKFHEMLNSLCNGKEKELARQLLLNSTSAI